MAIIRSTQDIAAKWAEVTPARAPQYEMGVKNPLRNWEQNARAADASWKAGVQEAVTQGRFASGVGRAGQAKWQTGAIEKGTARYGPGVSVGRPAYETGFAPFQAAIAGVQLPPRGARRDPRNLARVNAVVQAIIAAKTRVSGAAR